MTHKVGPAHVMASGSLPPGFPATEVDGEFYWDGGILSTRRWNGCSTPGRARTRWPSRSICGARAASCRAT